MNKVKWGVAVAAILVVAAVLLAAPGLFNPESGSGRDQPELQAGATEDGDGTAGTPATDAETAEDGMSESDADLEEEAASYVKGLTEDSDKPVDVEEQDAFVGADRPLETGNGSDETGDGNDGDTGSGSNAGADMSGTGISSGDEAGDGDSEANTGDRESAEASLPEITPVESEAPASTAEAVPAASAGGTGAETAGVAANDNEGESRSRQEGTSVDLPLNEETPVTIAELLGPGEEIPANAVFYVHSVDRTDNQGIWGIVNTGIIKNFAEGVAVNRGGEKETYRVDIPSDADELEPDSSSSFLGRLIYRKSLESYVYNYETGRVGKDPDLILPGQELVIVSFTPEELIAVYKHFARGAS